MNFDSENSFNPGEIARIKSKRLSNLLNSILNIDSTSNFDTKEKNIYNDLFKPEAFTYAFTSKYDQKGLLDFLSSEIDLENNVISESEAQLYDFLENIDFEKRTDLNNKYSEYSNSFNEEYVPHYCLKEKIYRANKKLDIKKKTLSKIKNNQVILEEKLRLLEDELENIEAYHNPVFSDSSKGEDFYKTAFDQNSASNDLVNRLQKIPELYSEPKESRNGIPQTNKLWLSPKAASMASQQIEVYALNSAEFIKKELKSLKEVERLESSFKKIDTKAQKISMASNKLNEIFHELQQLEKRQDFSFLEKLSNIEVDLV
ncbi:hypothetical protein AYI70_g62 [Smittium culicis]|uniref:Uncharacterized protein n=1 Tax=Smittium culicis TaxID=133412 RepID=A0A1R1YI03_9FUNG|nr:hypothetical protein AYI70_g62 [Smittium culicis]